MRPLPLLLVALSFAPLARGAYTPSFEDAALRGVHFVEDRLVWGLGDV
jgi:hypothetical protein